jgi:hypothetical protein
MRNAEALLGRVQMSLDSGLPEDEILAQIRELFAPPQPPSPVPLDECGWPELRGGGMVRLPGDPYDLRD